MTGRGSQNTVWDAGRLRDPHGQPDKALRVRAMFDAIAPTYELVNSILSAGRDRSWRRRAAAMARAAPTDRVLDVCCGTGDFARAFARGGEPLIVGCDFSPPMLDLARRANRWPVSWCGADAMSLPFASGTFDVVSCAFGVRNFQALGPGLGEMHRVLSRGGRAVILEFSVPSAPVVGRLYLFYMRRILPRLAAWISGDRSGAYAYLAESVPRFVDARGMIEHLRSAGFCRVEHRRLTAGIVTVFVAWKD